MSKARVKAREQTEAEDAKVVAEKTKEDVVKAKGTDKKPAVKTLSSLKNQASLEKANAVAREEANKLRKQHNKVSEVAKRAIDQAFATSVPAGQRKSK